MEVIGYIACFVVGALAGFVLHRLRHADECEQPRVSDSETRADVQYQNLFCYDGTANNQQNL